MQVDVGELHDMLGVRQLLYTFEHLRDTHLPSLLIALASLAIIVLFELVAPRFPGALLAVIGMTAASAYSHWSDRGIQVVGAVPSGLPHLGLPHIAYSDIITVLPSRRTDAGKLNLLHGLSLGQSDFTRPERIAFRMAV